jgi:putative ABC transport system permease protein
MYFARNYGYYINMTANDLKLITGLLIILCIVISQKGYFTGKQKRTRSGGRSGPSTGRPL